MYTVVSLTKKECLSGGNCSYIVRLSVRDLHGPTGGIIRVYIIGIFLISLIMVMRFHLKSPLC